MVKNEDIAKAAGVSPATVSRVLNNTGRVSAATRETILRIAQELGKGLDPALSRKKVLCLCSPSSQMLIAPLMQAAERYNLSVLCKTQLTPNYSEQDLTFDGSFDGILLLDNIISQDDLTALRRRIPVVECRNYNNIDREVSVLVDDTAMGYRLAGHLLETGKERIAVIRPQTEALSHPHTREHLRGIRAALAERDLLLSHIYTMAEFSREELLQRLLQDAGKVWDAVIFPEPFEMTVDLRKELERLGKQVPQEAAIAAFNESFVTRYGEITVAAQPLDAIAEGALFLIDSLIHRRFPVSRSVQLRYQPDLIIRSSTQPQE